MPPSIIVFISRFFISFILISISSNAVLIIFIPFFSFMSNKTYVYKDLLIQKIAPDESIYHYSDVPQNRCS